MDAYYPNKQETSDVEGPQFSFDKPDIRMSFIRKVYLILSAQLLLTTGAVAMSLVHPSYGKFIEQNIWLLITAAVVNIVTLYALVCYKSLARSVPLNYLLLSLFTVAEAFMVSAITVKYSPELVFIAACLTAGIVVSLTIYAMTTKTDFTMMGGLLFMMCMTLILASILGWYFKSPAYQLVLSSLAVLLFGLYLIYDTQLIIGGKSHELSVDDYIIGALMLYIDIVRIFIEVLRILAIASGER